MTKKTFTILAEEGLHARPASLLAKTAMKFKCDINMSRDGEMNKAYQAKSILSVMSIGASKGDRITFSAQGEDEVEAIKMIEELVVSKFKE
ncbi:MAG: phosphocarrier protein HPr [Firmicutes bacterium HGW-Firmicutes-7]|nr:MAG: phosphocarrier protein HPr [Firmicutes bacterium HGW-Firmicutes-7]